MERGFCSHRPRNDRQLLAKPNPFGVGDTGERIAEVLTGETQLMAAGGENWLEELVA